MEEPPKSRRRWYRFSLRTMLVLVTVMCIYFGWAMNWIRQRQAFLDTNDAIGFSPLGRNTPAPIWIRIVGVDGYRTVLVPPSEQNFRKLEEARRLFPEADIEFGVNDAF